MTYLAADAELKGFLTVPCECNITPPDDLLSDMPVIFLNCRSGPQGKGTEESSKLTCNNSLELIKAGPLPSWFFSTSTSGALIFPV